MVAEDEMDVVDRRSGRIGATPAASQRDRALVTLAAACGTVADERSGATTVVVVLGFSSGSGMLTDDLLDPLERRYGVRIAVLDEGSPTAPPTIRITRAAGPPVAVVGSLGRGGVLARLRSWWTARRPSAREEEDG
jgi:hypothetical protein